MYVKTNNFKPSRIRTYAKSGGSDEGSGGRRLVGEEVEGDDAEDGEGEEGGGGDQEEGGVGAEGGDGAEGELTEVWIVAPGAEDEGGAEDQGGEGERNQEELEAEDLAGGEPVDEVARGLGGLVGLGLNVAEEEGEHEGSGWEDEEEFEGGDGAFENHGKDFVVQSTVWCQVGFYGKVDR
jgi:hypothetical protein